MYITSGMIVLCFVFVFDYPPTYLAAICLLQVSDSGVITTLNG